MSPAEAIGFADFFSEPEVLKLAAYRPMPDLRWVAEQYRAAAEAIGPTRE